MRKFKLMAVALVLSAGALAGCNKEPEHVHTFSADWTSDAVNHWHAATCGHDVKDGEAAHTFGTDGKCSVCDYYDAGHDDARIFTDEKLGAFKGVFYSEDSVITISKDGVVVEEGGQTYTLQNDTIKGSGYSTVVTYKGPEDSTLTLKWKKAAWDANNLGLMLPTFVAGDNELQLQPAVDEAQGWYDGWDGYMDPSIQIYIVSSDFNVEKDAFQMYTANYSYNYLSSGIYLRSSFVKIGDKLELALSWFDDEDMENGFNYPDWNYYLVKDEVNGTLKMAYFPEEGDEEIYYAWWTRPSFFLGEFIQPSSCEIPLGTIFGDWSYDAYSFWADEDAKTVSINYGDDLPYVEGYDEKGAYVLVDGAKFRGTSYGISVETAEGVEECPAFFFDDFYKLTWYDYLSGNNSIAFVLDTDWDTWESVGYLEIDGEQADKSYLAIVDNVVVLAAEKGQDKYFMAPYDGVDAVLVGKNDAVSIYIESSKSSEFIGKYFLPTFDLVSVYDKEGSLYVKCAGEDFAASLAYDADFGVVVTFGDGFEIVKVDADVGVYALFAGNDAFYLFTQSSVYSALGEWTSGLLNIKFNDDMSVDFAGTKYAMLGLDVLQSSTGYIMPACVFGQDTTLFYALIDSVNSAVYAYTSGGLQYLASFIRPDVFASFYGEFNYAGEFGTERVSLSTTGELIVTTINEEGTGVVDVKYDYDPIAGYDYSGDFVAGLEFVYKDVPVDIIYDGEGHCSIFDVVYLAKVYFDNQGLYGSTADSNLYVVDNKVVYNGDKVSVTSFSADSITGTIGEDNVVISFSSNQVSVTVGESEPVVLSKNATQVSSFACDVQKNVGNLGEDIKVTEDGKILAHGQFDAEDVWNQITDYDFVIDADGNVSITFEYKLVYKYTIEIKEGVVVISGESSLPPLPPPPPLL